MNYALHILFVIFAIVATVPEWRRTALIICVASLANIIYQPVLNAAAAEGNLDVPFVHVVAEFITISALVKWGTKGWRWQAGILTVFMAWNLALLLDYRDPPYPIYENYKEVIFALNIIQVLLISGGIYAVVRRSGDTINAFLGGFRKGVPNFRIHSYGRHSDREQGR